MMKKMTCDEMKKIGAVGTTTTSYDGCTGNKCCITYNFYTASGEDDGFIEVCGSMEWYLGNNN